MSLTILTNFASLGERRRTLSAAATDPDDHKETRPNAANARVRQRRKRGGQRCARAHQFANARIIGTHTCLFMYIIYKNTHTYTNNGTKNRRNNATQNTMVVTIKNIQIRPAVFEIPLKWTRRFVFHPCGREIKYLKQ